MSQSVASGDRSFLHELSKITFGSVATGYTVMPFVNRTIDAQVRAEMEAAARTSKKPMAPYTPSRNLWSGVSAWNSMFVPTTLFQGIAYKWLSARLAGERSKTRDLVVLTAVGVGSAVIMTPPNAVIVEQRKQLRALEAIQSIYQKHGFWRGAFRALPPMAIQEGAFAPCLFLLSPELKNRLVPYTHNEYVASLLGGSAAGALTGLATQLANARITIIQNDPANVPRITWSFLTRSGWAGSGERMKYVGATVATYQVATDLFEALSQYLSTLNIDYSKATYFTACVAR